MEQPMAQPTGDSRDGLSLSTVRGTAICAGLGGLLLGSFAIIVALKPRGCVAEECVGRSYSEGGPVDGLLFFVALALIAAATAGVYRMHRFDRRGFKLVRISAVVAAVSVVSGAFLTNSALFFVGLAALILALLAFAVIGAGLMVTRVLPAWSGAMLLVTSLMLFGINDQNERGLLLIPFGVAWMVLGGLLLSAASSPSKGWHSRIQYA
ncbi:MULTISPECIES: hypothetical protein [Arthrobacter]|uniref:DUF998 domain-containing protein n=1 Tax=Arthrobacter oryzae TaxID=409290 RepID=A0A3N0BUG8_9MICC|nr:MULTISPECIES: hypothetical protein [Arthrobacter]QYF90380.1 hypothetical protein KY499_03385 [Arthrobacter sp. PAMC25284]RNL52986.1 hypothetical protein D7003_13535 [Arthrobacter oryzae]